MALLSLRGTIRTGTGAKVPNADSQARKPGSDSESVSATLRKI